MSDLAFPMIHLNGTSPEELQMAISEAHRALYDAMVALNKCYPNGRDYVHIETALGITKAVQEHTNRCVKLREIMRDLDAIFEDIDRQRIEREKRKARP